MSITSRERRTLKLLILLSIGEPVSSDTLLSELNCSSATLSRVLADVRTRYKATIAYVKASQSYVLEQKGEIDASEIQRAHRALELHAHSKGLEVHPALALNKLLKVNVSLSLKKTVLAKLDRQAAQVGLSRSELVEQILSDAF